MLKAFKSLPAIVFLIAGLIVAGGAYAAPKGGHGAHKHFAGHTLLGSKIGTDGKHEIHKVNGYTVHAHVSHKKVAQVSVTGPKGAVAVKKYKSSKKMAMGESTDGLLVRVASGDYAQVDSGYVGYAFTDGVDTYIYWFPVDMIADGDAGAEVYVSLG